MLSTLNMPNCKCVNRKMNKPDIGCSLYILIRKKWFCLTFSSVDIVEDVWHFNSLMLIRIIVIKTMSCSSLGCDSCFAIIRLLVSSVHWNSGLVCSRYMFGSWYPHDRVMLDLLNCTDLVILYYLALSFSYLEDFTNSHVRETRSSSITIWIPLKILYVANRISWENL